MNEELKKRIEKVTAEVVKVVPYDEAWPKMYSEEKRHLLNMFPNRLIKRIEHFGSTAVPGLRAKPIIDMLIEVSSLESVKKEIVPILKKEGYDYFWRPTIGNQPPYYAWFIKRNASGARTHHLHMVEADSDLWDRLFFRDYLIEFPQDAGAYSDLKERLSEEHPDDRVAYTKAKTDFISKLTTKAKKYYQNENT